MSERPKCCRTSVGGPSYCSGGFAWPTAHEVGIPPDLTREVLFCTKLGRDLFYDWLKIHGRLTEAERLALYRAAMAGMTLGLGTPVSLDRWRQELRIPIRMAERMYRELFLEGRTKPDQEGAGPE